MLSNEVCCLDADWETPVWSVVLAVCVDQHLVTVCCGIQTVPRELAGFLGAAARVDQHFDDTAYVQSRMCFQLR